MTLSPKDHAEAVAIFRSEIIGGLTRRELDRGELRRELLAIAKQRCSGARVMVGGVRRKIRLRDGHAGLIAIMTIV